MATNSHELGSDNPPIVGLTLPAGTYMVWAMFDLFDKDPTGNSQCVLYSGSAPVVPDPTKSHFLASIGGDTAMFSEQEDSHGWVTYMTTATLAHDNDQILSFCNSADKTSTAAGQIMAMKVDAVN
jgi:hypothetical protein